MAGIIDQQTADAIINTLDRDAMRAFTERAVMEAFQRGLIGQQSRLMSVVRSGNVPEDVFWSNEDRALWDAVQDALYDATTNNAIAVAWEVGSIGQWQKINEVALDWARTYYTSAAGDFVGSIPNLNSSSRQAFARAFERWNRGELGNRGMPDLINELSREFGMERAEKIASTEVTRIFTESERAAVAGNEAVTGFRLLTAADEIVCEICGPMHGQVRPKEQMFIHPSMGPLPGPPFHVRCRCDETPVTAGTLADLRPEWDVYQYRGPLPVPATESER